MAVIVQNESIAEGVFRMTLRDLPLGCAGQFYMVRPQSGFDPLLGRPISICRVERARGEVALVYQTVGRGTQFLCACLPGAEIDALGPYGNGFPLLPGRAVLIGGGIGSAPMLELAHALRTKEPSRRIDVFLGFREEAYLTRAFEEAADGVHLNIGGIVTNDVDFSLPATYYACGPAPMLRAAAAAAERAGATLYVSLEKHMACGVGACLGCTCKTKSGNRRVCKDGPVFAAREVMDAI